VDQASALILSYSWDFGDSTTAAASSAKSTTHQYSTTGPKTVTVTVTPVYGPAFTITLTFIIT
jgi:PKD repeat protein